MIFNFKTLLFLLSCCVLSPGIFASPSLKDEVNFYAPTASFTASTVCEGNATIFTNNSTTQAGSIIASIWDFGDGEGSSVTNPTHTYASSGAYTVHLTVIDTQGEADNFSMMVNVHPAGNLNFITSATNYCQGSQVSFTNLSNIVSGSFSSYTWNFGDGVTSSDQDPSHTYTVPGVYQVVLQTLSNNGCQATLIQQVEIYPEAIPSFIADNACQSDDVLFANTSQLFNQVVTYTWDFGDGSTSNAIAPQHNFLATGDYSVQLEITTSQGCSSQISQQLTIHPRPISDFTVNQFCFGSATAFTNLSSIASGNLDYQWSFGDGSNDMAVDPSHVYQTTGVMEVTLNATSNNNCSATSSQFITIYPSPIANFSVNNQCEGELLNLENNTNDLPGGLTFTWDLGDGSGSNDREPIHTYASPGSYQIQLNVESAQGCTDQISHGVAVYDSPQALLSVQDHCEGGNLPLLNLSTDLGATPAYTWDFGDGSSSHDASPVKAYPQFGSYNVTLSVESAEGCADEVTQAVQVNPLPQISLSVPAVCEQSPTLFQVNASIPYGSLTYAWNFGDGIQSTDPFPVHTYGLSGSYSVSFIATSSNGCSSSRQATALVNPNPVSQFTVQDHCEEEELPLVNQSTVSLGTLTFEWNFNDGNSSLLFEPEHTYTLPGLYAISLKASSPAGCQDVITKYVRVNPKPNVDFTVENTCQDDLVTFLNASTVSQGTLTHQWAFGDGSNAQQINPTHKFQTYGTFQVSLTATASLGQCQSTIVKALEIYQRPLADFEVADNCIDSTFTFDNHTLYFGTDVAYNWDFGNGQQSQLFSPEILFTAAQTFPIRLTATSDNGCGSSVEKSLKVFAKPTVNFFASNVCLGQPVVFANFSSLPNGQMEYNWLLGDGNQTDEASPSHVYSAAGNYATVLHVISEHGCRNSFQRDITVYPPPLVNFSASPVCNGVPVNFTNESTVAVGNISEFLWDFGDQTNSVVENPTYEFLNDGVYLVTLLASTDQGCSASYAKTFTVYPLPLASFAVTDVCDGETVNFQNLSTVENGGLSFEWYLGDGNTSANLQPQHIYQNFGVYNVRLTAISDEGCRDSVNRAVAVFRKPAINAGQDQVISKGYATQLSASGASDYRWEPIEGLSNSAMANPEARPLSSITYIVYGIDSRGCENSDTIHVEVNDEFKIAASNVLTPDGNGKNDTWVIENIQTYGDAFVRIYDRWGKLVYEKEAYQNDWRGDANGNLLPDGTYYYYISFRDTEKVYKGAITILRNDE